MKLAKVCKKNSGALFTFPSDRSCSSDTSIRTLDAMHSAPERRDASSMTGSEQAAKILCYTPLFFCHTIFFTQTFVKWNCLPGHSRCTWEGGECGDFWSNRAAAAFGLQKQISSAVPSNTATSWCKNANSVQTSISKLPHDEEVSCPEKVLVAFLSVT